jgi:hypothetical protein
MSFSSLPPVHDPTPLPRLHLRMTPSRTGSSSSTTSNSSNSSPISPRTLPMLSTLAPVHLAAPGPATPPSSPIEADGSAHLSFPLIASLLYTFPTGATLHPRTPSRNPSASSVATTISAGLAKH